MSKIKGLSAERIATRLLESRGFCILSTNYDIMDAEEKVAEIDIIAKDDDENTVCSGGESRKWRYQCYPANLWKCKISWI